VGRAAAHPPPPARPPPPPPPPPSQIHSTLEVKARQTCYDGPYG
jgi:hypothetical protein